MKKSFCLLSYWLWFPIMHMRWQIVKYVTAVVLLLRPLKTQIMKWGRLDGYSDKVRQAASQIPMHAQILRHQ